MKRRLLFDRIVKYLTSKEALIITGMRQVGKTVLMRQIYEHLGNKPKLWFDFDNPFEQKYFEDEDYRIIFQRLQREANIQKEKLTVFIDEIQNFPQITKIMKYLIDHYKVKFIVSGSSNYYLRNLFPESLSGRKFIFELAPLSFREYLYFKGKIERKDCEINKLSAIDQRKSVFSYKNKEKDYEDFLNYGSFPAVVVSDNYDEKKEILNNIQKSFFEKDLKLLTDYKDIRELRDLIILLLPRIGSKLDVSKIASELGVERYKIYSYLELLQGIYMIRLLPKFSKSIDRTTAGGKKIYFTDNGIVNSIGSVNEGQMLENAAVNQLSEYGALSYYSKENTSEIDVVIEKKIAAEIKLRGTKSDFNGLSRLAKNLGLSESYIVNRYFSKEKGFIPSLEL